jgi:hypothetical protein
MLTGINCKKQLKKAQSRTPRDSYTTSYTVAIRIPWNKALAHYDPGLCQLLCNCTGEVTGVFLNSVNDARLATIEPGKSDEVQTSYR